jgi:hypothetical protein
LIGTVTIVMNDIVPHQVYDKWHVLCSNPLESSIPKQLGRKMAAEGYVPKYPIVLVPGLASTALKVEEGHPEWVNQRIWLSLGYFIFLR